MKYNEKLVNDLEKIPDRFLDELNQTNVKKKKIKWTVPVSVAACAAAVIAVPVILSHLSHQNDNSFVKDDPAVTVSTTVTEAASVTDEPDNITSVTVTETVPVINVSEITASATVSESIPKITVPVTVTETSKPEVTEPDVPEDASPVTVLKYYQLNPKNIADNNGIIYDPEKAYYAVNFLKDKEFESQINSDIAGLIDSIPDDFEWLDSTYEAFYYRITKQSDDPERRDLFIIQEVKNGYLSVMVGLRVNYYSIGSVKYEHVHSLMYDLVEKRKIDSADEYFGSVENADKLIRLCCEEKEKKYEDIVGFTIDDIMFNDSNGNLTLGMTDKLFAVKNNMTHIRPRDFSEVLAEGFYTESYEISLSSDEEQ